MITRKKTITVSGYNRPDYFHKTLHSLSCCEGVGEYDVLCVLDPSDKTEELAQIARNCGFASISPEKHLGCGAAIQYCMEIGFGASEFHIHLEDDTVPAPDCLRWFQWAERNAPARTLTVSAYNHHGGDAAPDAAAWRHWFSQ